MSQTLTQKTLPCCFRLLPKKDASAFFLFSNYIHIPANSKRAPCVPAILSSHAFSKTLPQRRFSSKKRNLQAKCGKCTGTPIYVLMFSFLCRFDKCLGPETVSLGRRQPLRLLSHGRNLWAACMLPRRQALMERLAAPLGWPHLSKRASVRWSSSPRLHRSSNPWSLSRRRDGCILLG